MVCYPKAKINRHSVPGKGAGWCVVAAILCLSGKYMATSARYDLFCGGDLPIFLTINSGFYAAKRPDVSIQEGFCLIIACAFGHH